MVFKLIIENGKLKIKDNFPFGKFTFKFIIMVFYGLIIESYTFDFSMEDLRSKSTTIFNSQLSTFN